MALTRYTTSASTSPSQTGDAPVPEPRRRRRHTKSRAGCQNCKRRKCDEVKPCCGTCARFAIHCDFDPSPAPCETPADHQLHTQLPVRRGRGRPRKAWPNVSVRASSASTPATTSESDSGPKSPAAAPIPGTGSAAPLNALDLELMHHYTTHTAATMGDASWWSDRVAPIAFAHPGVLRMLLVVSAQHLLHRQLSHPQHAAVLGRIEAYSAAALRDATAMLPRLDRDNCQAVYLTTMLACFSAFARGPTPGHLLVVAPEGEVPWWVLMRGVRYILTTIGFDVVYSGPLALIPTEDDDEAASRIMVENWRDNHWEDALSSISRLSMGAHEDMYCTLLAKLTSCFHSTFGTASEPQDATRGRLDVVMAWLVCAEDEYKESVEARDPVALVLLAYFAVLLRSVEHYWFMDGWAVHIVDEVGGLLDERWEVYLEWPRTVVGNWVGSGG